MGQQRNVDQDARGQSRDHAQKNNNAGTAPAMA